MHAPTLQLHRIGGTGVGETILVCQFCMYADTGDGSAAAELLNSSVLAVWRIGTTQVPFRV